MKRDAEGTEGPEGAKGARKTVESVSGDKRRGGVMVSLPVASAFRRVDRQEFRGLRLSGQHPRMPRLSPDLRHRGELPRLL